MKLSDYLVNRIAESTGAKHAFLLSGGGMMHLLDSLGRSTMKPIPMHHEQAAAIAADVYIKSCDAPGVCFVTTGPGCTNAVTGVAGAFMDSHPAFYVSGQVSRANSKGELAVRQIGIQEIDPIPVVQSLTKYAARVSDPLTIRYHLERALFEMTDARPGPVWLDIPLDVQAAEIDPSSQVGFVPPEHQKKSIVISQLDQVIERFKTAKRPLLVIGGGCTRKDVRAKVLAFVERLEIPVQTTWNSMDLIAADHPLFVGRANLFGPRYANLIIQNCDFLLSVGARLGMQHTGYNVDAFAREAFKVMIDVDPVEMTKPGLKIDLKIEADSGFAIDHLMEKKSHEASIREWSDYCRDVKVQFPDAPTEAEVADDKYLSLHLFTKALSRQVSAEHQIVIGSSGMGHTIMSGLFDVKAGQRAWTSKGLAAMGYGLPSSISACFGSGLKETVCIVGDGGLQLNLQELQTIVHSNLPIKLFIVNNDGYHSIKMTQKNFFNGTYVASDPGSGVSLPSLEKVATCYDIPYQAILNNQNVDEKIAEVLRKPGPQICEIFVDPEKPVEPKAVSYKLADGKMASRPIEDMAPLLSDEELRRWLFVKPMRD